LQAVERYRENEPDLILMDVQMPEIDGLEATRRIREIEAVTGNHVPIIALTAGALKEEREKCFVAGMDDFLTKPVNLKPAKATLEKHLSCREENINTVPDVNTDNEAHLVYSEVVDRLDNDIQAIQTFLSIAINDIPIKIELIEQACGEKDYKKINEAAHALKGSALSMSCKLLANISEKIEINAANDHLENLPTLLSEIKAEWKIVKNILTQKIKKQS
jgi:CheY-like chemotaxis protein